MSKFTCDININEKSDKKNLTFEINGNDEYGLNRTIVNAIRRTLLSSIETYAFRTEYGKSDIVIEKNETSLHNEFILDRIGMIPLYIDPKLIENNPNKYLFVLNVKHDNSKPITLITAEDFDIYEIKKTVAESPDYQNGMITKIDKSNYDMDKKVSDKIKSEIFRPYKDKYYCLLHELKSTNSDKNVQELVLYGSPSVSIAKEDARWQAVSCSTYSYKIDEEMCKKIIEEKLSREELPEDEHEKFRKDLFLKEGQRYFHRDKNSEPYWYNFEIESQHFLSAKDLFIRANDIIIKSLEVFKDELQHILDDEEKKIIKFKYYNDDEKKSIVNMIVEMPAVIKINHIWHGFDDTLGSIIQTHISNHMINETSPLNVIGYKRTHPLEDKYLFTMSFNPKHILGGVDVDEKTRTSALVQELSQACDELIGIFGEIIKSSMSI
jgi:DNA-directed RNA polymerase alpha subunit